MSSKKRTQWKDGKKSSEPNMPLRSDIFAGTVRKWMIITVIAIDSNQWVRKKKRTTFESKKKHSKKSYSPFQFPCEHPPPKKKAPKIQPKLRFWTHQELWDCERLEVREAQGFPQPPEMWDLPGMWDPKNATSPRFFHFDSSKTGEVLI